MAASGHRDFDCHHGFMVSLTNSLAAQWKEKFFDNTITESIWATLQWRKDFPFPYPHRDRLVASLHTS